MTPLTLTAARFSSSIELDVLVVTFLMPNGDYILLQQGLTPRAGMNEPPYFELNDAEYGGYGLVNTCKMTSSQVSIALNQPLQGVHTLQIDISKVADELTTIVDSLHKIFSNDPTALSIT